MDAPSEALLPLARQLIQIVSDPALWRVPLEREKGVVDTEATYHGGANPLWDVIESAVFPQAGRRQAIIGNDNTLLAITLQM